MFCCLFGRLCQTNLNTLNSSSHVKNISWKSLEIRRNLLPAADLDVFACFLPWSLLATGMLVLLVTSWDQKLSPH